MEDINLYSIQQGWQCPVCRRVYAPWMAQCLVCGGDRTTITNQGTGLKISDNGQMITEEEYGLRYGQDMLDKLLKNCGRGASTAPEVKHD